MSLSDLVARYDVVLEYRGEPIVDSRIASILRIVKERGSLLAASKALGIPYSRVWEAIAKIERVTGTRVVETFRGGRRGGGAKLTEFGEKLLALYEEAYRKLERCIGVPSPRYAVSFEPDIVVAHSHDPMLSLVIEKLGEQRYRVDSLCIGSGMALAMLSLEEADVACIHLYDPETNTYNVPYLERFWLIDRAEKIGGYMRELVLAYRPDTTEIVDLDQALEDILRGRLRIVNRNRGSGTRVYLDHLLKKKARELGIEIGNVKGYHNEVSTHIEAAKQVALGRADVALVLRYAAELYGLKWIHVTWELYECYTTRDRASREAVVKMRELLSSEWIKSLLSNTPGYRVLE